MPNNIISYSSGIRIKVSEFIDSLIKEVTNSQGSNFNARGPSIKCISSNIALQRNKSEDSLQINHCVDEANNLKGNAYSQKHICIPFENFEEAKNPCYYSGKTEMAEIECLRKHIPSKKYSKHCDHVQDVLPQMEGSNPKKDYSFQTRILVEEEKILKCEDLKKEKEYLEESVQVVYPIEEEIYLNLHETSEILKNFQGTRAEEKGNDVLKSDYSKINIGYSLEKTCNYDDFDDDRFLKIFCSAFDFISKKEKNASCVETQKLISEILARSEDIHSEQYYVKSAEILLYFLDEVKRGLESKRDATILLKLDYEAMLRELDSYDNTKEGQELKESASNIISRCDKVSAGIDEDRLECEWYSKNLQEILNFFQQKCLISSLVQEEMLPKIEGSNVHKYYSEESGQTRILVEAEKLIICDDPKIEKEHFAECVQVDYPTENIYSKKRDESKVLKNFLGDNSQEKQKDLLKNDWSEVNMDYSLEKTWENDYLEDDSLLEKLRSAFDFICKSEENASYRKKEILTSETLAKSEDIFPEPHCVESVQILMYFLDDVKRDLKAKRDKVISLKLRYETMMRELNNYEITKEDKQTKKVTEKFDEVCERIDNDTLECESYSKTLQEMLNFF